MGLSDVEDALTQTMTHKVIEEIGVLFEIINAALQIYILKPGRMFQSEKE